VAVELLLKILLNEFAANGKSITSQLERKVIYTGSWEKHPRIRMKWPLINSTYSHASRLSISRVNVTVGVLRPWTTMSKPRELSQPPTFLLSLHLVACLFLFLFDNFCTASVLSPTPCRSYMGRNSRALYS
jgi:hypothetical protein